MSAKEGKQALPLPGGYLVLAQKCPKMACPGLLAPECLGQPPRLDVGALEDLPGQAPAGGGVALEFSQGAAPRPRGAQEVWRCRLRCQLCTSLDMKFVDAFLRFQYFSILNDLFLQLQGRMNVCKNLVCKSDNSYANPMCFFKKNVIPVSRCRLAQISEWCDDASV